MDVISELVDQLPAEVVRAGTVAAMFALAGIAVCLVGLVFTVHQRPPPSVTPREDTDRHRTSNTDRNHNVDGKGADQ